MNRACQLGMLLYQLAWISEAFLLGWMVHRKQYRLYPTFAAYLGFCVARTLVLMPLAATARWDWYDRVYSLARPISYLLLVAVCAELLAKAYGRQRLERGLQFASFVPACVLLTHYSAALDRVLQLLACGLMLATAAQLRGLTAQERGLLTGLLVATFPPAAAAIAPAFTLGAAQYIPTVSCLAGFALWWRALRAA